MPTISEVIASFAARLSYSDLPEEVVAKAKLHLLDLIGVALASSTMPFARKALAAAKALDTGNRDDETIESTSERAGAAGVMGFPDRLPPAWAALVNGTLAHGIDFDDTHQASIVHVSASVVPAALAAGEAAQANGERLVAALVIGMESAVRFGLVARGAFHDRGFHPTGICGTYAAALVAGHIDRLETTVQVNALGLCGSMAAGSLEFLTDGSWVKRLHGGWAAHGGLVATALARQGFTGPREVFEGRFGLYQSHLGEGDWDIGAIGRDLGRRWEMLDIAVKPYPCCHYNHAFIDCAAALRHSAAFSAEQIERVETFVEPREMPIVCEPRATKCAPQTDYDAKFSLPYTVACMLLRGHVDIDDFTPDAVRDPVVLQLSRRIECVPAPAPEFPRRFPGRLRIMLRDGRSLEHSEPINRGSVERPLSAEEVRTKFRRNAMRRLPPSRVQELLDTVDDLASLGTTRQLGLLLRADP